MDGHDGTNTQVQLMDGLQVPLDDSYGQPSLLPQGHHQAYQIDPQALLAQNHPLQGLFGQPAPLIPDRLPGRLDHFYRSGSSMKYPCRSGESRSRDRPPRHARSCAGGRSHGGAAFWAPFSPALLQLRPAPVGTGFQNPNPPLQIGNDWLAGNYLQQSFALAAFRSSSVSTSLVCHNSPGHASVFPTALSQFTSSSLNSYSVAP